MSVYSNEDRLGKLCDKINNLEVKDRKAKQFRVQGLTERLNVFEERLKELQTQDKQRISSVNVSINKVHEAFEKLDMTGEGIDKVSFTNLNESMGILNVEMKKETELKKEVESKL